MDRASAPEGGSGRRGRHRRARGALSALVVLAATALVIGTGCANVTVLSVSHAGDADGVTPTAIRVGIAVIHALDTVYAVARLDDSASS